MTLPTQEQEQRARWDLLLLDLEHRAEQVRQLRTYEGWRLAVPTIASSIRGRWSRQRRGFHW
jgi:hypothetical protein